MGISRYKTVAELPTTPLVIPQVDGTTLPIALKKPSEASKTLGVRAAPDGNPVAHLAHMKKCGLDWGDKLHTTYLPRRLAWMSHDLQLYPQMSYGLECLLATPMELSKEMQKVIRHCLPPLGVNRNIKSEFATISHKYQGISLPDWTAEKLAKDVNVLFRHWGLPNAVGKLLRHSYELLQMETGLQGNIFARSFTTFGCLASHSWMKILWQYSRKLRVSIVLVGCESVPLTRDGDIAWIDKLANMGFKGASLVGMNRVRKLKQVHSVSDTTACDGYSLLPEALTTAPGQSDREWSIEQPTKADFRLWSQAMSMVYECDGRLRTRLGCFIAAPHINNIWTLSSDDLTLCERVSSCEFKLYDRLPLLRFTRSGFEYVYVGAILNNRPLYIMACHFI